MNTLLYDFILGIYSKKYSMEYFLQWAPAISYVKSSRNNSFCGRCGTGSEVNRNLQSRDILQVEEIEITFKCLNKVGLEIAIKKSSKVFHE